MAATLHPLAYRKKTMIEQIRVQNFRCLKNIELHLEPLTILVGPNASGKSAVLDILDPQKQGKITDQDYWKYDETLTVSVEILFSDQSKNIYQHSNHGISSSHTTERQYHYQSLHLDLALLRGENKLARENQLSKVGGNLPNVFASLTRKQQMALSAQLCEMIPVFADVENIPTHSGNHTLRFQDKWASDVWYSPDQVSDGTMLMLAFLLLQFQESPPEVLVIEEPDRGLHPYLLEQMLTLLRKLSRGELGKEPIQIVLATHSAEFINFAEAGEVRFMSRNMADGASKISTVPTGSHTWQEALREYQDSLGEIWLSGSLGGV